MIASPAWFVTETEHLISVPSSNKGNIFLIWPEAVTVSPGYAGERNLILTFPESCHDGPNVKDMDSEIDAAIIMP